MTMSLPCRFCVVFNLLLLLLNAEYVVNAKSLPIVVNKPKTFATKRIRKESLSQSSLSAGKSDAAWKSGVKNSLASAMAAATSKIILAPFDTIKTLQQHSRSSLSNNPLSLMEAAKVILKRRRGFLELYVRHFLANTI